MATSPKTKAAPAEHEDAAERAVRILPPTWARYQVGGTGRPAAARVFPSPPRSLNAPLLCAQGHRKPQHRYDVTAGKDMPAWSTSLFAFGDNVQVSGARACLPRAPRQRAHAPLAAPCLTLGLVVSCCGRR